MVSNFDKIKVDLLHPPAALSADLVCTACDLLGFNSASFFVLYGADATPPDGTTNYWHCKLTECDEVGGTYTDVADADTVPLTGVTPDNAFGFCQSASEDNSIYGIGYIGSKRFIKVEVIEEGTVSLAGVAVIAVKAHAADVPVANVQQGS